MDKSTLHSSSQPDYHFTAYGDLLVAKMLFVAFSVLARVPLLTGFNPQRRPVSPPAPALCCFS